MSTYRLRLSIESDKDATSSLWLSRFLIEQHPVTIKYADAELILWVIIFRSISWLVLLVLRDMDTAPAAIIGRRGN